MLACDSSVWRAAGVLTGPPQHGVVEERELHLSVVLQRSPASRRRHIDVGDVEGDLHRQEGLSRVADLPEGDGKDQWMLSRVLGVCEASLIKTNTDLGPFAQH